jgi:eukaryotic-like serine/threonine-protein kinase
MLFRRDLDAAVPVALPGTEDGRYPVFSPDGRWVLFDDLTEWKKVHLEGGSPIALTRMEWGGSTWLHGDTLVYHRPSGLWRMPAAGGTPEKLTDREPDELGHWWPHALPDGETVLFARLTPPVENSHIAALNVRTGETRVILQNGSFPQYASSGHLLFVRREGLMAAPFDVRRLAMSSRRASPATDSCST